MYTIVLVNVKRFRARCGFYAIENKLLLLLLLLLLSHFVEVSTQGLGTMPHGIYKCKELNNYIRRIYIERRNWQRNWN